MAFYKKNQCGEMLLIPVDLNQQLTAGSFEHALNLIIDKKIDLSEFDKKYHNTETGAPAFSPAVLLKIVLYAYSKGILSSRKIEEACQNNIVFIALSGNSAPHFTTIAHFVSSMAEEIQSVFLKVLLICDELNLIGGKMFAVDGCKLPSNASKEFSGTFKDLQKKEEKFRKLAEKIIEKHHSKDLNQEEAEQKKEQEKINRILRKADKINFFLKTSQKKYGTRGNENQSNVTDPESAKIKSPNGMIQGYNGIAVADSKTQVIVYTQAFGNGQEGQYLKEVIEKTEETLSQIKPNQNNLKDCTVLADTNYHSEENLKYLSQKNIHAIIPDQQFRKRDERFKDKDRFNPKSEKRKYNLEDFQYDEAKNEYICPAGKRLTHKGRTTLYGTAGEKYQAKQKDCSRCQKRKHCLRSKESRLRILMITDKKVRNYSEEMKRMIDDPEIRKLYGQRMGIVEPVFSNITYCKGMNRFTLRGKVKVNTQWLLYCIVHNISKIAPIYAENFKKEGQS